MDGHTKGHIEVICGPMFSGKSEELIRRIRRVLIAKKKALVFKSAIDTRYDNVDIVSHNGSKLEAIPIPKNDINKIIEEVKKRDKENFLEVIGIDEAQFFGDEIVNIAERFAEEGRRVIISGLVSRRTFRPNATASLHSRLRDKT
jgi:thymidine kinase